MKFIKLYHPEISQGKINFIDSLLKRRIPNDQLLEQTYIPLIIKPDSPIQLFYRTLWCDVYLRRKVSVLYPDINTVWERTDLFNEDPPEDEYLVYMSISECIQYINEVTPPALKKDIPQNIQSIESIYKLMHFFLFEETNPKQVAYYTTAFYKIFRFQIFDTNWTPDFKKISFIRERMKTYDMENYGTMVASVEASIKSISEILKIEDRQGLNENYTQLTFHADTDDDIKLLYEFLDVNHFRICNLYCDENIGFFVSAYTNNLSYDARCFIYSIYSEIMK